MVASISRKYGLSPSEKDGVSVAVCYFIVNMYINPDNNEYEANEVLERTLAILKIKVSSNVKSYYLNTIKKTPATIDDMLENVAILSDSPKLMSLNRTVLYELLSRSWFGQNAVEESLVATEHLPTVVAMLNTVLVSSFYRKTFFGQVVDAKKRYIDANHFKLSIKGVIDEVGRYPDI